MPRTCPSALKTHLAGNATTTCNIWVITRKDTTVFRFTDHDQDVEYGGNTYQALNSQSMSALDQKNDLTPDEFEFDVILNSADIDRDDVIAGLFNLADVDVYLINYETPTDGVMQLISGNLGVVIIHDDNSATIEFRSLAQRLSTGIGRSYTHECDADFADARCGLTIGSFTDSGTLTAVTNNQVFNDTGRSEADNYYNYGLLTWTSGLNNGLSMEVKDFNSGTKLFTLVNPMPFTVQVGDTYDVVQGCDKRFATCRDTFSNQINFRGFYEIPGMDQILMIPDLNEDAGMHGGGY